MTNSQIRNQIERIRDLINKAKNAANYDVELQAHWAKYICLLTAGLLENGIKDLYSAYAKKQVSGPIANFVEAHLSQIRNPKKDKFLATAGSFKANMKVELDAYLQEQGRGDAIDSIMNNRHSIAHGKEKNVNLSLAQMIQYFDKAVEVLQFIEKQCNK